MRTVIRMSGVVLLLASGTAAALDFEWDELKLTLHNRLSAGVQFRMQDRSTELLGKTNVPGQSEFCAPDSCLSLSGDPEPNMRLVNGAGAFSGVNGDNGNLNYDKHDITVAPIRLSSDAVFTWGEWLARLRVIGFYDPVNVGFEETHTDTRFQPQHSKRISEVENIYAKGVDIYDAYVSTSFEWGDDRNSTLSVGAQTVRWGESTLVARNAISEINPPSAVMLHTPGAEISEIFRPSPSVVLSTALTSETAIELVYLLKWQRVQADPAGTFFGDQDLLHGTFADVTLGQFSEDPDQLQRVNGPISLISSTSLTIRLDEAHEARDSGQYGARFNWFAPFNGGTALDFYYLNYHSRYPLASAIATDASCTRKADTSNPNTGGLNGFIACQGFNGRLLGREDEHNPEREPLPVDTLRAYLEYPEDIHMFGVSFNTNIGSVSLAGEYSYRPNLPLQVHVNDLIFTALQPAFPEHRINISPADISLITSQFPASGNQDLDDLNELGKSNFPSYEDAVPSYLAKYRGYGMVQPHQVIPGYERFKVGQFDFTMIKIFSSNPFGAEQVQWIAELGGTQIFNMPSLDVLQLDSGAPNKTHASEGQDENITAPGERNYAHLNPHRQTRGWVDSLSWGLRSIVRLEYNNFYSDWKLLPTLIMQWDVNGTAPLPIQNFVEGRKQFDIGADINFTESLAARLNYQIYTGAKLENTYGDRDNFAVSLSYAF